MKLVKRLLIHLSAFLCIFGMGCSEDKTAGGVTDIGNSIAGNIFLSDGETPAAGARIVAYGDSWKNLNIADSLEAFADSSGHFSFEDLPRTLNWIFAASGKENLLTDAVEDSMKIVLGQQKSLSGSISETGGFVRIVGTGLSAELDSNGAFSFDSIPSGKISLSYVQGGFSKAHFDFETPDSETISLPNLKILGAADSILVFSDVSADSGFDISSAESISVELSSSPAKTLYGFVLPVKFNDKIDFERFANPDSFLVVSAKGNSLNFEVDYWTPGASQGVLWVRLDSLEKGASEVNLYLIPKVAEDVSSSGAFLEADSIMASLHFNGDAVIANPTDSDKAYGVIGYGATLSEGQSVSLDSINPCHSDFTLSAWVYWNGDNGNHQILFARRASWEDSTLFQWYYETNTKAFSIYDTESWASFPGAVDSLDTSDWNLLTLVSESDSVSIYVNGKPVGNAIYFKLREEDLNVPFRVGGNDIAAETWNGSIDEVHVLSKALSAEWIRMEFETQRAARN